MRRQRRLALEEKKAATRARYNTYAPIQLPTESDEAYLRRLAKVADQRLVRLEQAAAKDPNKEAYLKYAYANAAHDIKTLRSLQGSTKIRFNTVVPKNKDDESNQIALKTRINAVTRFLEDVTSTQQGIKKVYINRVQTINAKYGTNFTWEDLRNFFERGGFEQFDSKYGSDAILRAIGVMQRREPKAVDDMKKKRHIDKKVSDDVVGSEVADALQKQGLTLSMLY